MTPSLTIDFETFHDVGYNLRDLSYTEYVRDPRFHIYGASLKFDDEWDRQDARWIPGPELHEALTEFDWGAGTLVVQNMHFDGFVLHEKFNLHPARYVDTLSMSRAHFRGAINNDLDTVAAHLGWPVRKTDIVQRIKGKLVLSAEELEELAEYCENDSEATYFIAQHLLPFFPEDELALIDMTARFFCEPKLLIDVPRAERALAAETAKRDALIARSGYPLSVLSSNPQFAEALTELGVTPPKKISLKTKKSTFAFALGDQAFLNLRTHPSPQVRALLEGRIAAKSTITTSRLRRLIDTGQDGAPFPIGLLYWGAHPGRFSGTNKANPQNMPRGSEMRKCLIAPEGQLVAAADSAQVEARINGDFSGQEDLVTQFRNKEDVYSLFASRLFNRPVDRKNNPEDEQPGFVGKVCILGLGYNMGAPKLQYQLAVGAMGGAPLYIDLNEAYRYVNTYREQNANIVAMWNFLDNVLPLMASEGVAPLTYKMLTFRHEGIDFPNGTALKYPGLRETPDGFRYFTTRGPRNLYGGAVLENICQKLARDITVGHMLIIHEQLPIVSMSHDEIIGLTTPAQQDEHERFMISTMSTSPWWMPDVPLAAEVKTARYYDK